MTLGIDLFPEYPGQCMPMALRGDNIDQTYTTRVDSLRGTVSHISRERAAGVRKPGITASIEIRPEEYCRFCNYEQETPADPQLGEKGRLHHAGGAVSFRNLYSYGPLQLVTALPPFRSNGEDKPHKLLLAELGFRDVEALVDTEYDIAELFYKMYKEDPSYFTFRDFVNWGVSAGASIQHPHFQRSLVRYTQPPQVKHELENCRVFYIATGKNLFDEYIRQEKENKSRVIYEDSKVFVAASFAPHYDREVIVIPKAPFAHILQTTPQDRAHLIDPVLGIFPCLYYYFGSGNVNIGVHMSHFGTPEDMDMASRTYRWHMHITPRRDPQESRGTVREAGSEVHFEDFVIGEFPEDVARIMRRWYRPEYPDPDPEPVLPHLRDKFYREVLKQEPPKTEQLMQ